MRQQGFVRYGVGRDVAPLFVVVPKWTRLNTLAIPPDSRPQHVLADAIVLTGYLRRLRGRQ